MESCSRISSSSSSSSSSSLYTSRFVSWYVDPAESPSPATATEFSDQNQLLAGPGSVPLLLLSPPEPGAAADLQQPTFTQAVTLSHHSQSNPHSCSTVHNATSPSDDSEEGNKGNLRTPEADSRNKEEPGLLHPEDEKFHLPRSSPVISRRHRPVSWHGGGGGAGTSDTSSSDPASPASGSLSVDQHRRLTAISTEDMTSKLSSCQRSVPVQVDERQRCISDSSNLNRQTGHSLPCSGNQRLAEEHRGRSLTSGNVPHTPGLSISTLLSRGRKSVGVPDFSADIFKTSCELEKENAHFIVVDLVLEVLEGVKWTLSFDQQASAVDTHQHTQCKTCTPRHRGSAQDGPPCKQTHKAHSHTQDDPGQDGNKRRDSDEDVKMSHRDTRSSSIHQHTQSKDEKDAELMMKTLSVLSTDSGFEDGGVDALLMSTNSLKNAEWLAQRLVLEFRRSWLPSREPQRGRKSLRSSLQELPGTGEVAVSGGSLTEEIRLRTRMRGSLNWAPPRFQIIFSVQPTHRRSEVVASQHFLCAGCGTEVEPRYIKKLRYCEYLGRYFCDCCHSGSEAVIPGRVLSCWDFGRYSVSDFSRQLLDSVWHQPLFDLTCVGKTLYSRVKELEKFRELQQQLLGVRKLLTACRFSQRVVAEFEQLPVHLMERPHLFSMDDLLKVKKGQLVAQARAVLHSATAHVENCELCRARGFICEFCRENDIIFPFQRDVCTRCTVCKACFHKDCFVEKKCPKCARILSRRTSPHRSTKCDV